MSAPDRVDLREVSRPNEEDVDLLFEGPRVVVDYRVAVRLTTSAYSKHGIPRIIIVAPITMPITFDKEGDDPVFHKINDRQIDNPNRLSAKNEDFGDLAGKRRFYVGDYAFTCLSYLANGVRIHVASPELLYLDKIPR